MKKQLTKITALVMAFVLSFVTLASTDSIQQAYAKGGSKEPSASRLLWNQSCLGYQNLNLRDMNGQNH